MPEHELVVDGMGGMCPVQGHGTLDGERFYFRFRHDDAQLYVGPVDPDDEYGDPTDPPRLYAERMDIFDDPYRGYLDHDEAMKLLHELIGLLRPYKEWPFGTRRDQLAMFVEEYVRVMKEEKEIENGK